MSEFKEYHSFGGVDITPVFGNKVFGEMSMVSYRADREKAPVFTMGSPDAKAIARGKRYVSGACVFTVFDRDSLLETMDEQDNTTVYLSKHESANYQRGGIYSQINGGKYQDGYASTAASAATRSGGTVAADYNFTANSLTSNTNINNALRTKTKANLADQVLAFDISLVATNEYGHTSKMVIYGVELMSEAGGVSVDDLVLEKQMSFIAKRVSNWMAIDSYNSK